MAENENIKNVTAETEITEKSNRGYKNSMFVDLFYEDESAKENEIALYNALHDEPLPEGTEIQKMRIDNVLYMNFKNDISFGVGGKLLIFGEHQSSINENMPLRDLMYIGRAYEQIVPVRQRYRKKLIKLPRPEFYTFYNGKEKWGKEQELRLSDAYFEDPDGEGGKPMLDLTVKVININPEENHEILKRCPVLNEYSQFVEIVRKHQESGVENPFQNAVNESIQKGILSDYLQKKGSEAVNMLKAEYDYDMDIAVQREEAKEEGIEIGKELGRTEGIELGRTEGIELGRTEGIELGRTEGIELGRTEGIELGRTEGIELGRTEGIELGRTEGIELGRTEGIEFGKSEGMNLLALLIQKLQQDNRQDDIVKALADPAFRNELLREYGLQ